MAFSFTKFVKRFTQVSLAFGLTAALSTSSFGGNATWLGTASGTNAGKWGTATGFGSNWSPTGNAGFGGLVGDDVTFGNSGAYSVTVSSSPSVGSMTFNGGALAYSFSSNNASAKTITVGAGGISNTITSVKFEKGAGSAAAVKLALGANQTWSGTGSMDVDTVTTSGKALTINMTGLVAITTLTSAGAGSVEVSGGSTALYGGTGPATLSVSGGLLTIDSDNDSFSTVSTNAVVNGGNMSLNGYDRTFSDLSISSGILDLVGDNSGSGGFGVTTVSSYAQTGGEIHMEIASLADYSKVIASGSVAFGGTMSLDMANLATPSRGDSWNLFNKGSSQTSTTGQYNFVGFNSSSDNADLASLTWTQDGQEWKSSTFADSSGNFFVFQSQNGVLMVVPEPSTYAMGAVGLATAGFFRWRSRRRAAATA